MNKVIFLDIDGVLNSNFWNDSHKKEISDGILIDEAKIKLLSELVKSTGAKIILHSGWKYWFDAEIKPLRKEVEKLKNMLEKEEIFIEGVTPDHSTEEIRKSKKFSLIKAGEILAWLEEHKEFDRWVVIDDLYLHNDEISEHQVKTDSSVGLTIEDAYRAEKILLDWFSIV